MDINSHDTVSGWVRLERANVQWFLSIDRNEMEDPPSITTNHSFRSLTIDGEAIEFSAGFEDLHTNNYKQILRGMSFSIRDSKLSIELASKFRTDVKFDHK